MSSSTEANISKSGSPEKRRAGAFDMRNFIAALIGIYGGLLLVAGVVGTSDAQLEKSDGVNINLWAGIGMLATAALFIIWARLRPVVVVAPSVEAEQQQDGDH